MKDNLILILCIFVYTITFFLFGSWVQVKIDRLQLRRFEESAFIDGCKKCAQFEKNKCERDQLQVDKQDIKDSL